MTVAIALKTRPGIKRDGTRFEGDASVDGQWCRWQRELARKIGGYRMLVDEAVGLVRQFHTHGLDGLVYTHIGGDEGIQRFTLTVNGVAGPVYDRTPAGLVVGPPNNLNHHWMFDSMYSGATGEAVLIAHPENTLDDISAGLEHQAYIGDIYATTPLTVIDTPGVSGGIVVLHPYLFMYCKSGFVKWSDANDPTNFTSGDAGDAYISGSKVVKALPLRGGGQSPAGLFWTLDSLIRCTYVGGAAIFQFDTVTASTSVLAVNGIIEYDGIYYWAALDRFQMYNGVVREVPNNMNLNWFYDNLNYTCSNKVFAMKVPRYGEIWWCYPRGEATECTHAVIYNVRENTWYDTELPNGGRSAGLYAQVFRSPLMAGTQLVDLPAPSLRITEAGDSRITEDGLFRVTDTGEDMYRVWQHEFGVDEIDGVTVNAVESYFETSDISMLLGDQPKNQALTVVAIEPDFVQVGNMQTRITGRMNARSPEVDGPIRTFTASAADSSEEMVYFKEQRRELRFWFGSNTVGGDYQQGQILVHVDPGDGRERS